MFARVSTYYGKPGRMEEAFSKPLPRALEEAPGFRGAYVLVDQKTGKGLTITLWESEETMHDSIAIADRLRQELSEEAGGIGRPTYEVFEVLQQPERVPASEGR